MMRDHSKGGGGVVHYSAHRIDSKREGASSVSEHDCKEIVSKRVHTRVPRTDVSGSKFCTNSKPKFARGQSISSSRCSHRGSSRGCSGRGAFLCVSSGPPGQSQSFA